MEVLRSVAEVRHWSQQCKGQGQKVGLVPTMGALHEGHQQLILASVERGCRTAVSIFVNPLQFGPGEDYDGYPRCLDEDLVLAAKVGADVVFAPTVDEMYPAGNVKTRVEVGEVGQVLCGVSRPIHFSGMATVVTKLLNMVQPSLAFFGAKDAQQVAVVRQVVRDLNIPVEIVAVPTVREPSGLALSSRNRYLTADEHERASAIFRGLTAALTLYRKGQRQQSVLLDAVRSVLEAAGMEPEYIEIRSWDSLDLLPEVLPEIPALLATATRLGKARLIDNVILDPQCR